MEQDLCKTCEHYWVDFKITPDKEFIAHCEILDSKKGLSAKLDNEVPYPCMECPFNCFIKKK